MGGAGPVLAKLAILRVSANRGGPRCPPAVDAPLGQRRALVREGGPPLQSAFPPEAGTGTGCIEDSPAASASPGLPLVHI